jgi:ribosomal protein S18 acetylase RimI-like enzyme
VNIRLSNRSVMAARSKSAPFVRMTGLRCWRRSGAPARSRCSGASSRRNEIFSEKEIAYFLKIDFESHVALVALLDEDGRPVIAGGGGYIQVSPGRSEIAFVVVDAYQGQGLGAILLRHIANLGREAGLTELIAEVLPENTAMLKVFKKAGFKSGSRRDPHIVHLTLQLAETGAAPP